MPKEPRGIVVFAHGGGLAWLGLWNTPAASRRKDNGLATLLFDLLTPAEGQETANVLDIPLLTERMVEASLRRASEPDIADLPMGFFGRSTSAAAALFAAAGRQGRVVAVASREGRPDLANAILRLSPRRHCQSPAVSITRRPPPTRRR